MTAPADYLASLDAWKGKRLKYLKAADGWLNIIGRWWLEPGTVSLGTAADNDLVLSAGPPKLGTVTEDGTGVTFVPANGGAPVHVTPNKKHPPQFIVDGLINCDPVARDVHEEIAPLR